MPQPSPRQNRVDPFGEIRAVSVRGTFMGNRGILHDADGRVGTARWRLKAWLVCRTDFRGRHRQVMAPNRYTELFFLDEATALAAGHRPCFECRRRAFLAFRDAWAAGNGWAAEAPPRVADIDSRLHTERVVPRTRRKLTWTGNIDALPDGTVVAGADGAGTAFLLLGEHLLPWRFEGYGRPERRPANADVTVLTPPSTVAALAAGYAPVLHPSVYEDSR
ncbi:hypothetical protein ABIE65_002479 [Constrictibacter sp. MBR-5]|jgi:hypothetical protein|uniref:hypothetical protein n=1 Tax=Constrictibacter sp. MBR-5 TaxID=3156467 RepID=UPI00339112C8